MACFQWMAWARSVLIWWFLSAVCPVRVVPPTIELAVGHAEDADGEEVEEDQRQGAGHGFERTADDESPLAAGEILQHQEAQAAAAEAEAEHEAVEPGAEEMVPMIAAEDSPEQWRR